MGNKELYYSYRIRLEKLKYRTWFLIALAKFVAFLAVFVSRH